MINEVVADVQLGMTIYDDTHDIQIITKENFEVFNQDIETDEVQEYIEDELKTKYKLISSLDNFAEDKKAYVDQLASEYKIDASCLSHVNISLDKIHIEPQDLEKRG